MILSVSMLMATMMATEVEACTNFIVGKKASVDGSVICSYSADSFGSYMPLYHYAAGKHAKGTKRKVYEWDTNKYLGEIDEAEETYNVVGNTNEWQVTIGETTYGGREEMVDSTGIIDYGSLIYIALQRSRSAREAIRVMTSLVEQYGYYSEGETFTICDADEAWIMEMQGCGPDRKVSKERTVWVALRIPDDAICAHANQSRIGRFNMKDKKNVLYSKNVVKYAYEGTPLAIDSTDIGGGIWQMPYRPTPLYYKVDGKTYFNERPISTQQASFVFVSQMRSWLPREIGGCFWFGNDDGNMVAFVPIYCSMTQRPECFNAPGADAITFSDRSAFWVCNWVSNMVYPRYSALFPDLKQVRDSLQQSYFDQQAEIEAKAQTMEPAQMQKFLNDYSVNKAQQMLARWKQLATYLIVRHNDMAVKPVDAQGRFLRSEYGFGKTVERPGYPQPFARRLVKEAGDRYSKPE